VMPGIGGIADTDLRLRSWVGRTALEIRNSLMSAYCGAIFLENHAMAVVASVGMTVQNASGLSGGARFDDGRHGRVT